MTPERARKLAEDWTTCDKALRALVLVEATTDSQSLALVTLAIDGIYGPKAGPQYVRAFLRLSLQFEPDETISLEETATAPAYAAQDGWSVFGAEPLSTQATPENDAAPVFGAGEPPDFKSS